MTEKRLKEVSKRELEELTPLERQLAYAIYQTPAMSKQEMERQFHIHQKKLERILRSKIFINFQLKLETSIIEKMIMAKTMAMDNALGYLKKPESDAALDTMKLVLKNVAEHPGTMPAPEIAQPEFYNPPKES